MQGFVQKFETRGMLPAQLFGILTGIIPCRCTIRHEVESADHTGFQFPRGTHFHEDT
jgi:hypothetical protein